MITYVRLLPCLAHFFFEREMFLMKAVSKIKTQILCSMTFSYFFENLVFYEIKGKNIVLPGKLQIKKKGKGKALLCVLQHCCLEAYCTLTQMSSFIHLQRRCTHQAA